MTQHDSLVHCVQRGANFLDSNYRSWEMKFPEPIRFTGGACILTQLYGCYCEGMVSLGLSEELAGNYGLRNTINRAPTPESQVALAAAWDAEIAERKLRK